MNCFLPCSTQSKCYQALYDLGPSYLSHLISYHSPFLLHYSHSRFLHSWGMKQRRAPSSPGRETLAVSMPCPPSQTCEATHSVVLNLTPSRPLSPPAQKPQLPPHACPCQSHSKNWPCLSYY